MFSILTYHTETGLVQRIGTDTRACSLRVNTDPSSARLAKGKSPRQAAVRLRVLQLGIGNLSRTLAQSSDGVHELSGDERLLCFAYNKEELLDEMFWDRADTWTCELYGNNL